MKALNLSLLIGFLVLLLQGCSSVNKKTEAVKMKIASRPSGAGIYSIKGEKLGVTPITLEAAELGKLSSGDSINFIVKTPGYLEREVVLAQTNFSEVELQLTPNSKDRFDEMVLNSFSGEINGMVRSLLMVQGLIFLKKYEQAALKLNEIQPKYPLVAAVYTLLGNIYLNTGRPLEAREQFSRAVSLDPADDSAKRFLNQQK